MALIVQKYGGASLSDNGKLKSVARRIKNARENGDQIIAVVSAMARTTDDLIAQIKSVATNPDPREVDCILATGELVSSAILSLALKDLGCGAKSFSGSQAGISTNDSFSNAFIKNIDPKNINECLARDQVAVVAGFQGITSRGDTTTLGRGGSDTSALAIAARFKADRCEILKDVPAIFSANPNVVHEAHPIKTMSYSSLLNMTFWGAKVVNYRAAEIAHHFSVPLYVGPAHSQEEGTLIKDNHMIEESVILAFSSHEFVLRIAYPEPQLTSSLNRLFSFLNRINMGVPQILHLNKNSNLTEIYMTGPRESMDAIIESIPQTQLKIFSAITVTCRGSNRPDLFSKIADVLETNGISITNITTSSLSISIFIDHAFHDQALRILHHTIMKPLKATVSC